MALTKQEAEALKAELNALKTNTSKFIDDIKTSIDKAVEDTEASKKE